MTRLVLVHHSPTTAMRRLSGAVLAGASDPEISGVEVVEVAALDFARGKADQHTLLDADAYLLGTTANFGYMSGALKHMFDCTFLHIGGALDTGGSGDQGGTVTAGRPFGLYVHGRYDVTGAVRSVLSMTSALGWIQAFDVAEFMGDVDVDDEQRAYELGATVAAVTMES